MEEFNDCLFLVLKSYEVDHGVWQEGEVRLFAHPKYIISIRHNMTKGFSDARESLITAIDVILTMISISDSKVSKRLAGWAAILAIPTMIAGIYGMNFKYMPELEWQWGYPTALLVMVILDSYLLYRFRKAGWI